MLKAEKQKAVFCWSGGKDSALALYYVLQQGQYDVKYLLTTVNGELKRVSMHGVRESLIEAQAESIGIPLVKVYVHQASNAEYEQQMEATLLQMKAEGIELAIFGDIFLEDLRVYREANLKKVNMKAVFPLWKRNTKALIVEFLSLGFKTITCCVSDSFMTKDEVGKVIDNEFINNLNKEVDPCGENGEYHSFCYEGPLFKKKIVYSAGEKVYKALEINSKSDCSLPATQVKGFWYCELQENGAV